MRLGELARLSPERAGFGVRSDFDPVMRITSSPTLVRCARLRMVATVAAIRGLQAGLGLAGKASPIRDVPGDDAWRHVDGVLRELAATLPVGGMGR